MASPAAGWGDPGWSGLGKLPPSSLSSGSWAQNSIFRLYASYQYDQFLKLDQFAKDLMPVTGAGQELDWQKTEWKEYFKLRQIASIGGIPQDLWFLIPNFFDSQSWFETFGLFDLFEPPASPSLSLLPIRIEVEIKRQDSSVQFLVYWIKALVALKDWLANLEGFWLEHWGGDDWCQRIVIKSKFRLKPENRRNHVNEWEIIWFHIWRRQIVQTDRVKGGVGK